MSRIGKPILTKLGIELRNIGQQMERHQLSNEIICATIKKMFDQVSEFSMIQIDAPVPPGDKPYKTTIRVLNPQAEIIIQMGLDFGCDWAKQKAAQLGIS